MRVGIASTNDVTCRGTQSLWGDMFTFSRRNVGLLALTLLYDPALLGAYPSLLEPEELSLQELAAGAESFDLLIIAHPTGHGLPPPVTAAINGGLPALLICPEGGTLTALHAASAIREREPLLSMNEEWMIAGHSFDYPQALSFARWHLPPHARIHSTIGEWPDAAILGHLAITATDRGSGG